MENFLLYIGKSGLAAGAFYLLFLALFQNKKQFLFNRIYLPVSLAISFLIPLITFTSVRYIETQTVNYAESFAYLPGAGVSAVAEPEMEWTSVLFLIYLAGTMLFLGHLLLGHYKAFRIVRTSKLREFYGTIVNVTSKDVHPFSFFNKIVLSRKNHPESQPGNDRSAREYSCKRTAHARHTGGRSPFSVPVVQPFCVAD